jgi:hypothetical protein
MGSKRDSFGKFFSLGEKVRMRAGSPSSTILGFEENPFHGKFL